MTNPINQIYKCPVCGNIIEVIHVGGGTLVCCGQKMELLHAKTQDQGSEKHLPIIEKTANGFKVKIGSIAHPMEDDHYIEWIELIDDNQAYRQYLKPDDAPEAEFCVQTANVSARAYCNLHGLWQT